MKKYSPEDVKDALKDLVSIPETNTGITENRGISNKIKDFEITPGTRDAMLLLIDPNMKDGFTHKIGFLESNTTVYARISNELGISWAPDGKWKKGIFYADEGQIVHTEMIMDLGKWQIKGAVNQDPIFEPGTTIINRGNAVVKTSDGQIILKVGSVELKVDSNWAYINGKRICVAPCGGWVSVADAIVVWYDNHFWTRDLYLDEGASEEDAWNNNKDLSNIEYMWPAASPEGEEWNYTLKDGTYGFLNRETGAVSTLNQSSNPIRILSTPGDQLRQNIYVVNIDGKEYVDPIYQSSLYGNYTWNIGMDTLTGVAFARITYQGEEDKNQLLYFGVDNGVPVAILDTNGTGSATETFTLSSPPTGPVTVCYNYGADEEDDLARIYIATESGAVDIITLRPHSTEQSTWTPPGGVKDLAVGYQTYEYGPIYVLNDAGTNVSIYNANDLSLFTSLDVEGEGIMFAQSRQWAGTHIYPSLLTHTKIYILGYYMGWGDTEGQLVGEPTIIDLPEENPNGMDIGIVLGPL